MLGARFCVWICLSVGVLVGFLVFVGDPSLVLFVGVGSLSQKRSKD